MGKKLKDKIAVGGAVSIRIKEALDQIAKLRNISRSAVIEEALEEYVMEAQKEEEYV
ncbi:MAG: ribbon-helix-helix protein, CopG family [Candidatus Thermoplasmatota archaeon]